MRADTAKAGYCVDCGAPVQTAEVQRLLYLVFLCHEIKKHEQAGRLGFETTHDLMREANERVGAMRRQLDGKRIPMAELATELERAVKFASEPVPSSSSSAMKVTDRLSSSSRYRRTTLGQEADCVNPGCGWVRPISAAYRTSWPRWLRLSLA